MLTHFEGLTRLKKAVTALILARGIRVNSAIDIISYRWIVLLVKQKMTLAVILVWSTLAILPFSFPPEIFKGHMPNKFNK